MIGVAVSTAAVVLLVTVVDLGATAETLAGTDLRWVALTLLMVPFQVMLRGLRWRYLLPLRADGGRPSTLRVVPVLLVGYLGNLILPARMGEPVRAYLLARREKLQFTRVLGSILLERVIDLATLASVAVLAAIAAGAPGWMVQGMALVTLVGVGVAVILVTAGIPRATRLLSRVLGRRLDRVRTGVSLLISFGEGAGGGGRATLALAVGLSTATWFFVAATYWLLGRSLDLGLDPAAALLIAAVATLGTAIPSAPAHIGTFEVAAVVAATGLGVPPEAALALALLAHVMVTVPFALAGGAVAAWMSISFTSLAGEAAAARPTETTAPPTVNSRT